MDHHASGSSAIVVVGVIVAAVLRGSVCTDVTHGTVSNLPHAPPPPLGGRDHPPALPAPLPSSLQVDVTLGQAEVHLHLLEDPGFEPEVPVWELYTDSHGKQQAQRAALSTPEYSVYHDLQKEADVMVFRDTDDNGTSLYRLEGVVHSGGHLYDLKSTGRRLRRRHRRQTQSADDLHHSNHSSGAQGGDGEEEEEEMEIEAKRLSDWQADDADFISTTLDVQTTKEMTGEITVPTQANLSSPLNPPSSFQSPSIPRRSPPSQRKRRAVTQDIHVDVVALVDYGVYKSWYDRSNETEAAKKKQDALEKIRRYYAFVLNGVNMLYQSISTLSYTIHVRLSSVMVATTRASSNWTEQYRVSGTPWDEVNANQALLAVSSWAATTDLLPPYDHLMLFTGYDLTKTSSTGVTSDKITGLAYTSTACNTGGKATSIVEDLGGFQCIGTATHELGHGLSAEHDGNENQCRSEDRYIMAAGSYSVTSTNKLNPWKFSSCSVNYFSTFIDGEVGTSRGRTCLYNTLAVSGNIPDVTSQMEGQLYDVDAQCRQVYGSESRLCRGPEFGEAEDVCTEMFCYDPTTASTCYQLVAARGTTCGNGKWCEDGQCVSSSRAPSVDENCVFGDQPGLAFDGLNCSTFVDDFPGYCYQEVVRVRCCASCARHYRLVQDCEYGDNSTGCSALGCSFATTGYLERCCGTCQYGSTFTTTTPTTTTPTTTTTPAPTTSSSTRSTSSTTSSAGTTTGVCADNSSVTINQMTCPALVSANPRYCYDATVTSICCLSCRQASSGVAGCEYGDQGPTTCQTYGTAGCGQFFTDGTSYSQYCCATCGYVAPTTTTTSTTTTSTTTPTTTTIPTTTTTTPTTTTTTTPTTTTTTPTTTTTTTPTTTTTTIPTTTTTTPTTTTTTTPTTTTTTPTTTTTTTPTTTTTTPTTTTTTPTTTTTTPTTTTTTTSTTTTTTPTTTTTTPTTTTTSTTTTTPTTSTSTTTRTTTTTSTTPTTTTTTTSTTPTTTTTSTTTSRTTPTTMTSTTTTTSRTTTTRGSRTSTTPTTTSTATATRTWPASNSTSATTPTSPACVDVPSEAACAAVSDSRWRCYDVTVLASCCRTCSQLADARSPDCEYGDRRPDCAANSDDCQTKQRICCHTCAGYAGDGGHVTADVMVHVIAAVVSLMLLSIRTPEVW